MAAGEPPSARFGHGQVSPDLVPLYSECFQASIGDSIFVFGGRAGTQVISVGYTGLDSLCRLMKNS